MGQVSHYNAEDAATICAGLAEGNALLAICQAMGLPYATAMQWEFDHADHGDNAARARQIGCEAIAEEMLGIADTPQLGVETITKDDGKIETREGDMIRHRQMRIDTRKWLLSKWHKKYAERQQIEHSGSIGLGDRFRQAEGEK